MPHPIRFWFKALTSWAQTPLGQTFFERECEHIDKHLPNTHQKVVLHLGVHPEKTAPCYLDKQEIIFLTPPEGKIQSEQAQVHINYKSLPIESQSVDLVILQHTLDYTSNPHQLLREVERILKPNGEIMITGFHPWGVWGIWRFLARFIKKTPWSARFMTSGRVLDWLKLLGFEKQKYRYIGYLLPFSNRFNHFLKPLDKHCSRWLPTSAGYLLIAQKKTFRPQWVGLVKDIAKQIPVKGLSNSVPEAYAGTKDKP